MKRMMRITLALMIMLMAGSAEADILPVPEADGRIDTEIVIDGIEVEVCADVYGSEIESVQAYQVEALDLGARPEDVIDLSVWFGEAEVNRWTMWTDKEVVFETEEGARLDVSPYFVCWRSAYEERISAAQYDADTYRFLKGETDVSTEGLDDILWSDLLALTDEVAAQSLCEMTGELGVDLLAQPLEAYVFDLEELNASTALMIENGVRPDQMVVEDWTRDDEHVRMTLPLVYHGLPVLASQQSQTDFRKENTPRGVQVWLGRRGVERMEFEFTFGAEKTMGKPFAPITPEEALEACKKVGDSDGTWGYPLGVEEARIDNIYLGYVMLPQGSAVYQGCMARPAWVIEVQYWVIWPEASRLWQGEVIERAAKGKAQHVIAIDAETGESLLYW